MHRIFAAKTIVYPAVAGFTLSLVTSEIQWWFAPGALLCGLILAQFLEVLGCMVRSHKSGERYNWRWAMIEKASVWALWICMIILDGISHLVPILFDHIELPILSSPNFLPFSLTFTFVALIAELKEVAQSARIIQGSNATAAELALLMLGQIQQANQLRLRVSKGGDVAPSRLSDQLGKEDMVALAAYLQHRGPAPAWLVKSIPSGIPIPPPITDQE